jgi:hypothetical protein
MMFMFIAFYMITLFMFIVFYMITLFARLYVDILPAYGKHLHYTASFHQIHDPYTQIHDPYTQIHDPNTQIHDPNTQIHDPNTQIHNRICVLGLCICVLGVRSQESAWTCICVLGVPILPLLVILLLDFGTVPIVWYLLFLILLSFRKTDKKNCMPTM